MSNKNYIAVRLQRDSTEEEEKEFTSLSKASSWCYEDGMTYWGFVNDSDGNQLFEGG